ncbi:MAG: ribonuclease P protein component [Firmicutes bacterium]|nr:ribonuclease P protein component [Bacillota bacterium]
MERLRSPRDFGLVYRHGTPLFGKHLVLSALPTNLGVSRVGFAVSKKVGNAVIRNKVKRRLREITRELSPKITVGYDLVIGAKSSSAEASFEELKRDLCTLMQGSEFLTRNIGGGENV